MSGTVKVAGLADLEKALFALGSTSTARRVGQRALMKAAEPMVALIQRLAPDDPKTSTFIPIRAEPSSLGRSKDTAEVIIGIDWRRDPPAERNRKSGKGTYRDPGLVGVGPMLEFGTTKMAAKPFMRPGFEAEAAATIVRVGQTLGPEIEQAAARLARKRAR